MLRIVKEKDNLYRKIVTPVYIVIITLISIFCFLSGSIIINLQNKNTMNIAEQSMEYVYRNMSFQLNNINSFLATMTIDQEIESILEKNTPMIENQVSDYIHLYSRLQNYSLMSVKSDIGGSLETQISYFISVISEDNNPLSQIANSQFSVQPGLYGMGSIKNKAWYSGITSTDPVWWVEEESGSKYICLAKQKNSIRDGSKLGILTLAYDINNIKTLLKRPVANSEGYFLLTNEENRVIFSPNGNFAGDFFSVIDTRKLSEKEGTFAQKANRLSNIVMFNTLHNGWKIIAIVPEKSIKRYTGYIILAGILAALISVAIAGVVIRRTANRVSIPIRLIVKAMKRAELEDFKEELACGDQIIEIRELYKGYNNLLGKINLLIKDVYIRDIQQKQLQLSLLQSQINPHFLYNTLDIINCMAITLGAKDISRVARSLATVFKLGLNRGKELISLEDELKQVKSYLDIQKLMHSDLNTVYDFDETINQGIVINLIIQPLVENAIIHGFKDKISECTLTLSTRKEGDKIVIGVADNGRGIDAAKMNAMLKVNSGDIMEGYGIMNVDRRIKLLFGDEFGIQYLVVESGCCAKIRLPLRWTD